MSADSGSPRRLREQVDGLIKRSRAIGDEAKQMVRFRMMWIDGKDLLVELRGFDESSSTMVHYRLIEERLQCQRGTAVLTALKFLLTSPVSSVHRQPLMKWLGR
jgi:hypothetical protein